jgi:peptidylprolyl isomerase
MTIKQGDKVKVRYVGTFDDGTVFDSNVDAGEPLEFTIGKHDVIKGFEDGVLGMVVGQEKKIDISPENAYGQRNEQLLQHVLRELFKDFVPEKGQQIGLMTKEGFPLQAKVVDVSDKEVTLDMNHPLAGKTLHFNVTMEGVV